jgi:peptide-methionine (S)-S-oxide reductase
LPFAGATPIFTSGNEELMMAEAILAGGCFWCTEAVFRDVIGVSDAVSGYIGGDDPKPTYKAVCSGTTGHAEAILITYDAAELSYGDLLDIFMATHNPTQLNRQGNDVGTQYRSALYWTTDEQADLARRTGAAYDAVLRARGFDPITTETLPAEGLPFWYAEAHHQQYLAPTKNPRGYDCHSETGIALPPL